MKEKPENPGDLLQGTLDLLILKALARGARRLFSPFSASFFSSPLAAFLPAGRAMRVDPTIALRHE